MFFLIWRWKQIADLNLFKWMFREVGIWRIKFESTVSLLNTVVRCLGHLISLKGGLFRVK